MPLLSYIIAILTACTSFLPNHPFLKMNPNKILLFTCDFVFCKAIQPESRNILRTIATLWIISQVQKYKSSKTLMRK